jgi:hypothetical protein
LLAILNTWNANNTNCLSGPSARRFHRHPGIGRNGIMHAFTPFETWFLAHWQAVFIGGIASGGALMVVSAVKLALIRARVSRANRRYFRGMED